ncbi:Oxidoreductase FAD-binding domain protein [Halomonas sp. A3H3]|uniref:FAD-binding oxidoreductase n=1 Tax=Halomonas sp. A3H3 TaxID=1346287 RepID=UPI00038D38F4|nr:FAD-binding oxidoreductase [Halomonas sp. A3H3]CDG56106.1 Oxidoreductase FAD-binding domain protein [Halomonas sp. A3H3]
MPDPKFTKPWHGVPREEIHWNPTVIEDACIGCGTCVTGCSRLVYRYDFERKKPVVVDPLNCMVGCTTCANTCPANAIEFPPLGSVLALEGRAEVRHAIEDDLLARHDILASPLAIPHPDRIIELRVEAIDPATQDVIRLTLAPVTAGECFCEFVPGQYLEVWQPGSAYLSRAYSIANAPHDGGRISLHLRRVEGGRFTAWAFADMRVGDVLQARGPLGDFTMRSAPDAPLLLIAGGTGLAPILALLEQQVELFPDRDMVLLWGMGRVADFYALDTLQSLAEKAPGLTIVLASTEPEETPPALERLAVTRGNVVEVLNRKDWLAQQRDIYAAGPTPMLRELTRFLDRQGIDRRTVHVDSFAV